MQGLAPELSCLPNEYGDFLFSNKIELRLAHHLAHVACEGWLAMELAFLVNQKARRSGKPAWSAILECGGGRVDVRLIPSSTNIGSREFPPFSPDTVCLHLKLIETPKSWNKWKEVRTDLEKSETTFAVVFVVNPVNSSKKSLMKTEKIPKASGLFNPDADERGPLFAAAIYSHRICWPYPILKNRFGCCPNGFEAVVKIVWILSSPQ